MKLLVTVNEKDYYVPWDGMPDFIGFPAEVETEWNRIQVGGIEFNIYPDEACPKPDWAAFRSSLYNSPDWYRVKNSSIEAATITNELWHLLWNYDRSPELRAEILATIAALKVVANPTLAEKTAIVQIMRDCNVPDLIIQAVGA